MGRGRRDKVHLTEEQREKLEQISCNGYTSAKKNQHARILLMCNEGKQAKRKWTDEEIGEVLQVHRNTVGRIRQRFLQKREKLALERQLRKTPPTPAKVDGSTEAQMEVVLDLYSISHSEEEPLVNMDEASVQLLGHLYEAIALRPGQDKKEDYHYTREGVRALFRFFDPNRDSRTRIDWAEEISQLLDLDYPKARKVKLVCDRLNTHNIASLYEAFPAPEAHRLARRLEIYYTSRNGSWLNVAEIELSILAN